MLRVGTPQNSDMVCRTLTTSDEVTPGAPAYIDRHGISRHPDALDGHRMAGVRSSATRRPLPLKLIVGGAIREIVRPVSVSVNAAESHGAAANLNSAAPRFRATTPKRH